jgi:hypothetical protein
LSRFTVSDKYAGKKGPCPKCKKELIVPDKSQEVVIHAPESAGPKDSKGVAVLKPLKRAEFKLSTKESIIGGVLAVLSLGLAIYGRVGFSSGPPTWLLALGVIGLAFPLAWIGYTFFHDDELAEYSGQERLTRVGICALVFAASWGLYWFLAYYMGSKTLADVEPIPFAIYLLIIFGIGTAGSLLAMELEIGESLLHYAMYFGVTFLLAMVAGLQIASPLANESKSEMQNGIPPVLVPTNPPATPGNQPVG